MKEPASPTPHATPVPPAASPGRRRTGIILALAVCVLVAALVVFNSSGQKQAPRQPAITVSAEPVKVGDVDVYLDALGSVVPVYTVSVTSRVEGALTEVDYREGQMVKKGDLLAIIDPRPYQAALLQAQGQLARDQAMLENARIDLGRYQDAYQTHAIPEQQLATQKALVEQDEGVVTLDQGNLAAAQVNLDYTRITSPIDGRVGLRGVDPGNLVSANGTVALATITQLQPITVIFTLAEDELSQVAGPVAAGQVLKVRALDRTQEHEIAEGTLLTIDNQINPATGTVRARAIFPNSHNELFPNQFVNVRLLVKTLSHVDIAPAAAIQRNNDAAYVYVTQPDGTIQTRTVKILQVDGESAAVTGVQPGETVVTDGFDKLQNGSKVTIRPPAGAAAASSDTTE
jgi:multidrug efflux system membrane fusion protein